MTTQTPTKLPNLATIVFESEEAAKAAAKAQQAAEVARTKAEQASLRAEAERVAAYQRLLDVVTTEAPERRSAALTEAGERRSALESAVRGDGGTNVFQAYLRWVEARVQVWSIDAELGQIRDFHGLSGRSVDPPAFDFAHDIGGIVDHIGLELQDEAERRIADRRSAFANGAIS